MEKDKVGIKVKSVDADLFSHPHFSHVPPERHEIVLTRPDYYIVAEFYIDGKHEFTNLVERFENGVHLAEGGGNYVPFIREMYLSLYVLTQSLKLDYLTVYPGRPAIERFCRRIGMTKQHNGEYLKVVM